MPVVAKSGDCYVRERVKSPVLKRKGVRKPHSIISLSQRRRKWEQRDGHGHFEVVIRRILLISLLAGNIDGVLGRLDSTRSNSTLQSPLVSICFCYSTPARAVGSSSKRMKKGTMFAREILGRRGFSTGSVFPLPSRRRPVISRGSGWR